MLVRDWLGVIAQVAATAATPFVTAAVPREPRIDPYEKKTKKRELRRVAPRSDAGGRCHWRAGFHSLVRSMETPGKSS